MFDDLIEAFFKGLGWGLGFMSAVGIIISILKNLP